MYSICDFKPPGLDSTLRITARDNSCICEISWQNAVEELLPPSNSLLSRCCGQLEEYFAGQRRQFELPLCYSGGTAFRRRVWEQIAAIPYATSITYGQLAQRLGQPRAVRAVGGGCGGNPISIIIPCHRVLGSGNRLTGYGGGLSNKEYLLELEQIPWRR